MAEDNPLGRWDILLSGLLNLGMGYLERNHGMNGLEERMKPFIEHGIKTTPYLKKAKMPDEIRLIGETFFRKVE
jgi:hypothetical protein